MKSNELFKKPIEIKIPDSDLIINIKSELPWYDEVEMLGIKDQTEQMRFLIWKMIDSWNLVEDDGTPTPITKELTDKFNKNVILPIYAEILKRNKDKIQKKKTLPKK
jgi:hypothetical protein